MLKSLSVAAGTTSSETNQMVLVPQAATVSLVTTTAALRDLELQWRNLEANTQNHTGVFQSFDWIMAWAETYVKPGGNTSIHIIAAHDNNELVFVWPLMRSRRFGFSVLSWLTDPFGQYGDVLVRKGHCTKHWIAHSINFLKRLNDIDLLRLRHVREDSHLGQHAPQLFVDARMTEGAPFLDLTGFADEASYDARYTSIQRKRRKKIRKSLEALGPVTFKQLPAGSLADHAMATAIKEKNAWLAERGRFNRVLGCPGQLDFLKALSRRHAGTVDLVVTEMKAGDRPVSWEIGFRHAGIHYAYVTSHVNSLTDMSPGRLHMDLSQRACLAAGMTQFDLMVPNDAHKETWSSGDVTTHDRYLPLSLAGRLVGAIYIRNIRPLMRSMYYSLNANQLRKLKLGRLLRARSTPPKNS
jgi:CelD/BcsL family acetyltransferase involved in cellulose biosynthesis